MPGNWKVDENGNGVWENGAPVWVTETGEEKTVPDYGATLKHISSLNKESAERKAKIRELEAVQKHFEGIEDIPAFIERARQNEEAVASFDDAKKASEQNIQARINAAVAPKDKKIAELEAVASKFKKNWDDARIAAEFGLSKFVKEETVNADMVKQLFAPCFSVDEDGRIVARDKNGTEVVAYDSEGNVTFDAVISKLVKDSPFKDTLLVGTRANGSGGNPNPSGRGTMTAKTITRAEFERLDPVSKMARMKDGYEIAG